MSPVFEPAPRCEPRVDILSGLIIALGKIGDIYAVLTTEIPDLTQMGDLDYLLVLAFDLNLRPGQGQRKGALGRFFADSGGGQAARLFKTLSSSESNFPPDGALGSSSAVAAPEVLLAFAVLATCSLLRGL